MANRIEKKLVLQSDLTYDYQIDSNGDFTNDNSYDTDIIVSLRCDRRASEDEVPQPEKRRGWHGDVDSTLTNYKIGSKLWLLFQSRFSQQTANDAKKYVQECLSWVTKKDIAQRVSVVTERRDFNLIVVDIKFYVGNQITFKSSYEIWKQSELPTSKGES